MEENDGYAYDEEEEGDEEDADLAMLIGVSHQMASIGDLKKKKSGNKPENIKERMVRPPLYMFSRSLTFFCRLPHENSELKGCQTCNLHTGISAIWWPRF